MTEQNDNKSKESGDKLRKEVAAIINDSFKETRKKEMEHFVSSLDPLVESADDILKRAETKNIELKQNMFKHKIALITFNGVLLALMVGGKDSISFSTLPFTLLFLSIAVGLAHIIIHYFKNEYSYIETVSLRKKLRAISEMCKHNITDEDTVNDARSFLRNIALEEVNIDTHRLKNIKNHFFYILIS